jgi:hypothetical protein
MITMMEQVAFIYMEYPHPKKNCTQDDFSHLSLKIVLIWSKSFTLLEVFTPKMRAHLVPLHPVVAVGPFAKWGINFIMHNLTLDNDHNYIIVVVDYMTKIILKLGF